MRLLRESAEIAAVPHAGIRELMLHRLSQLTADSPEETPWMGEFVLVEPGDTSTSLEAHLGCPVATDPFGETSFGDADFSPSFEWLAHHPDQQCFEMFFLMTDDGDGTVLWVPEDEGIDPEILHLCWTYAVLAP